MSAPAVVGLTTTDFVVDAEADSFPPDEFPAIRWNRSTWIIMFF